MLIIPLRDHKIHTERLTDFVKGLVVEPEKLRVLVKWDQETFEPIEAQVDYAGYDSLPEDLTDQIRAMGKIELKTDFDEAEEKKAQGSDLEKIQAQLVLINRRLEDLEATIKAK
jgi:hypothetical protein